MTKNLIIFLLLCAIIRSSTLIAQSKFEEIPVKASFITSFIAYTRWPANQQNTSSTYQLCITGKDPYSKIIKSYPQKGIRGRSLKIKKLAKSAKIDDIKICDVLIILLNDRQKTNLLLKRIAGLPLLTISEIDDYREQKSMINLRSKNNQIVFSINRNSANKAGLEFSSSLLRLADKVIEGGR